MTRIPDNLQTMSAERLAILDAAFERSLKREIDRLAASDIRFARVLRQALAIEDEVERRKAVTL